MSAAIHNEEWERFLQDDDSRNGVLYIIYLCVLACCCVSPCLYYVRISFWQRRRTNRLRDLEQAGMVAALAQSTVAAPGERDGGEMQSLRDERQARILQLMEPVRMTLTAQDFRTEPPPITPVAPNVEQPLEENEEEHDIGRIEGGKTLADTFSDTSSASSVHPFDHEEETTLIEIPVAGLNLSVLDATLASAASAMKSKRLVPGFCTICLSGYKPGSDIVWSSNSACDHVFHQDCMKQWLMKLSRGEGPVCPCCRQDFIVDPYDYLFQDHQEKERSAEENGEDVGDTETDDQDDAIDNDTEQRNRNRVGEENEPYSPV